MTSRAPLPSVTPPATPPAPPPSHERLELVLLRTGITLAATLATLGGVLYLIHHGTMRVNYARFGQVPIALRSVRGVLSSVATLEPQALIQCGVIVLLATPVARVALALWGFVRARDWTFTGVTALVLGILLLSMSGAIALR